MGHKLTRQLINIRLSVFAPSSTMDGYAQRWVGLGDGVVDQRLISLRSWSTALAVMGTTVALASAVVVHRRTVELDALDEWFGTDSRIGLADYLSALDDVSTAQAWQQIAAVLLLVTLAVTSYKGVQAANGAGAPSNWTPGWAAGAWFVPIVNVIAGPMVLNEIFARFDVDRRPTLGRRSNRTSGSAVLLGLAWAGAIALGIASVVNEVGPESATRNEFAASAVQGAWSAGLTSFVGLMSMIYAISLPTTVARYMSLPYDPPAELLSATETRRWLTLLPAEDRKFVSAVVLNPHDRDGVHSWVLVDDRKGSPGLAVLFRRSPHDRQSDLQKLGWRLYSAPTNYSSVRLHTTVSGRQLYFGLDDIKNARPAPAVERLLEITGVSLPEPRREVKAQRDAGPGVAPSAEDATVSFIERTVSFATHDWSGDTLARVQEGFRERGIRFSMDEGDVVVANRAELAARAVISEVVSSPP